MARLPTKGNLPGKGNVRGSSNRWETLKAELLVRDKAKKLDSIEQSNNVVRSHSNSPYFISTTSEHDIKFYEHLKTKGYLHEEIERILETEELIRNLRAEVDAPVRKPSPRFSLSPPPEKAIEPQTASAFPTSGASESATKTGSSEAEAENLPLPKVAPVSWVSRDKREGAAPPKFIEDTYGTWLGKGLDRAHLRRLDPKLVRALDYWSKTSGMPLGFDLPEGEASKGGRPASIPDNINTWVARFRAAQTAGNQISVPADIKFINRLAKALYR